MRFNVTLIDPVGERYTHFLFDLARYVLHTIELLGHDCTLERNRCIPEAINILVGTHLLTTSIDADVLLGAAQDYIVLQTEVIEERSLNGNHVGDRLERVLFPLLQGARAVWDTLDTNIEMLAKRDIRAEFLRFGYNPRLEEIHHKASKDIDFLFYGSVGVWRRSVLQKLDSLGYRVRVEFDAVALYRNDLIARSEVVLTMRHGSELSHLPHARIIYAVNNRCLVVGEGGHGQAPIEDVFAWTNEPSHLVDLCRETRARKDRRALAERFHEKLRSRPMTSFLAPLLSRLSPGSPPC
jgi:hypothetical protein